MSEERHGRMMEWVRGHLFGFAFTGLFLLFIAFYLLPNILIFIYPGQGGVLWHRFFGGTVVEKVYEEGTHLISPWDKMYVYNLRTQEIEDDVTILTENGLTINMDLSIRYRPNPAIVGLLHKLVGPDYVDVVVIPEVEAVVRTVVGRYKPEEVYRSQEAIAEQIVAESAKQLEERYVKLDDILIKRISLPEAIMKAIESKLVQQQMAEEYDFRLQSAVKEAKRKRIDAEGINNYNMVVNRNLSDSILKWQGVQATKELAASPNAKVVVIGAGKDGLPIILGNQ